MAFILAFEDDVHTGLDHKSNQEAAPQKNQAVGFLKSSFRRPVLNGLIMGLTPED